MVKCKFCGDNVFEDDHITGEYCCKEQSKKQLEKSNVQAFRTGWAVVKGGVKNQLLDMVYEVKDLVENQQVNAMEAARFVAEQNDPTDRRLGRLLFSEYVRMMDEGML